MVRETVENAATFPSKIGQIEVTGTRERRRAEENRRDSSARDYATRNLNGSIEACKKQLLENESGQAAIDAALIGRARVKIPLFLAKV